jgi:Tfp pilus assembly protein PilF
VQVGEFEKAVEDFNAALNVNNRLAEAWAWRGVALERQGQRSEAAESYRRALSVEAANATAKQGLARLQGGTGGSRPGLFGT